MGFNPLDEKGIPLEKQFLSWDQVNVKPFDRQQVHPYTRTRVILMNGIEVEGAIFKHQFARHTPDMEVRRKLAATRRVEQQQQKMVNWLIPGDQSNIEVTLGFEQVAVDLTAWLARHEKDAHVKEALDFALLEDFDHLYRYANLYQMVEGKDAADIIGSDLTEVMPGRPTADEHQHPFDTVRQFSDGDTADILSKMHILTIIAAEQQTMNLYMNLGNRPMEMLGRGLYAEIAQIEEQHVTHYESLADPTTSWWEMAVLHEYNECFLYYSCLKSETDPRIKKMWQFHLDCEIDHLQRACEMLQEFGDKDVDEVLPAEMPEQLVIFESNKEYVREILATQVNLTANLDQIVGPEKTPATYKKFQKAVNSGGVPSREIIKQTGDGYRLEILGPHPVKELQGAPQSTRRPKSAAKRPGKAAGRSAKSKRDQIIH